MMITDI